MAIERELSLADYIGILSRRLPYVLGSFALVFSLAVAYALWLSPVYQSTGKILIESQQIQSDSAKKNYANERFEVLKQLALSKENLQKIAKKYNLYNLDKMQASQQTTIDNLVRLFTTIELLKVDTGDWGAKATFAFQVTYNYYKPEETYAVTNDLVKLFLDENDRASKGRVIETAEFYSKEAEKQKIALEKIEKEVTRYKQQHSNSLPENKDIQLGSLERLDADLRATQREYSETLAELRTLDVSLESAKAGIGLNTTLDKNSGNSELELLKLEFAKQSSVYSENHPSLRVLQRRIDALEKNSNDTQVSSKSVTPQSVMIAKVQAQIDAANARLKLLDKEEASIRSRMNRTESLVIQSSQTEGVLGTLLRDYENAKVAYAEIKAKQDNSKIAKNIEMENKGERFVLIESPVFPEKAVKPNRWLIMIGGFFGAIASAIGFAFLLEALDKRLRGTDVLASALKLQPIAVIPYITNQIELKRKKYTLYRTLLGFLIGSILILLLIHVFFMPLDALATKIMSRF
jgi:polysaccharide biosynthesis transport protein